MSPAGAETPAVSRISVRSTGVSLCLAVYDGKARPDATSATSAPRQCGLTGLCRPGPGRPDFGQEADDTPRNRSSRPYQSEVEAANPGPSNFHVAGGVDVRDQYFFRGYNRSSSGVIIQPYFDLGYTVYRDENLAITPHAGAWFNFAEDSGLGKPDALERVPAERRVRGGGAWVYG